jgi:protein CpxP
MKTPSPVASFTRLARVAAGLAAVAALGLGTAAHAQGAMHGAGHAHAPHGPGGMQAVRGGMHGGGGAGMEMRGFERMLDRVQATPEQRAQIRKIMESAQADVRASHEAGRAQRGKMAELLARPEIDAAAVEAARQQLVARHDAASKRMTQALLEAGRVLTPEQREKLAAQAQQRREMMHRHHQERRALEAPKS